MENLTIMNKPAPMANFFEPETLIDPFGYYRAAHETAPILPVPAQNLHIVFNYDLVAEATGRTDEFSNDFGALLGGARAQDPEIKAITDKGWPGVSTLLTADPPVHTRFRKLVNLAFSMPRVNAIEADIRAKVITLIEGFADKGECEFLEAFAVPLPVSMIAKQIGLEDQLDRVKRWSDSAVDQLSQMITREREIECARDDVEFQHVIKAKIDERRAHGGDDLLNDLVQARIDGEQPLNDPEIMSIMNQFMVAGNETTTSTLAGAMLQLIRHPDQLAKAAAAAGGKDPKVIANLVEEALRTETPTAGMWRVVTRDSDLGGHHLPKGSMLHLRYAAANRDPSKFPEPDRFDIERPNVRSHLAFGKGIHMCVGNMLSRKEVAVAFDELLARLTNFAVADDAAIIVPPNMLLRGITKLPIRFEKIA
jgi:cytochrome P450